MSEPYETHACIICGCTKFVKSIDTHLGVNGRVVSTRLEACTLCGTVRDINIVAERFKEKHHESTDER